MRSTAPLLLTLILVIPGCSASGTGSPAAHIPPAGSAASAAAPSPAAAPRELATDPARVADDLVADETVLRDPGSPDDLLTAAARRQQAAYRAIGRQPDWDAVVRPRIPQPLVEVYERNVDARRHLEAVSTTRGTVPAWRIGEPAPADELLGHYRAAEAATGVGWNYLAAINLVETLLGRVVGASSSGARGPMQFLPTAFAEYGELINVRYRDGIVAFANRKHFFTDWSNVMPELAADVTATLSSTAVQAGKNLNAKDAGGAYLPGLPVIPRAVTYIPSGGIDTDVVSRLRTGDYVGAYAQDGGLDVTHVGVFVSGPDGPVFRNASSLNANGKVVDEPFLDYVRTVPGIVVLRPVQ